MAVTELSINASAKRKTLSRKIWVNWQLYALLLLPTAFLVIFNYLPMVGAQIAFKDFNPVDGVWGSPWVGLQQFNLFLNSPYFWPILQNTLRISLYGLGVGIPCAVILAIALNEVKHVRFKKTVQLITYAPYFISTVVMVGILQIILNPSTGLFGQFAHLFGVSNPYDMLGTPGAFPSVYVWSGVWQETGYAAVIYLAALSSVSPELYEAAKNRRGIENSQNLSYRSALPAAHVYGAADSGSGGRAGRRL